MKSLHILVVDDDPTSLLILVRGISRMGYPVTTAAGGREAVRLIEETFFDVVITDLMMSDIDGIGVLKAVKARNARTEVLLLTASQSVKDAVEAMKNGASDYFQKPANLGEIELTLQKIETWKEVARSAEQLREAMDVTERNAGQTIHELEMETFRLSSLLFRVTELLSASGLAPEERIDKALDAITGT